MASAITQVQKLRDADKALLDAIATIEMQKERIVDLGGAAFVAFLDDTDEGGNPIYDISSSDLTAIVPVLAAINDVLDANNGAYRKVLTKLL